MHETAVGQAQYPFYSFKSCILKSFYNIFIIVSTLKVFPLKAVQSCTPNIVIEQ